MKSWKILILASVLLTSLVGLGRAEAASDWPTRPVTIVVPFDVGGSVDRLARGIAQFLPKELGQPVTVVDRPGAGGQIGATFLLSQPDDGYTLMVTPAIPYLAVNILITNAHYTLDDFAFINAQWIDFLFLAVAKDRPYKTVSELIDAIKANPGKLSAGVTFGSQGHFTTLMLLEALHLPSDSIKLVTFDGGGSLRTALAGGQVDFSIVQAEGSETVLSLIRPLAVFLDKPNEMFGDTPPINDTLKSYEITIPQLSGSIRTLVAPAGFKTKHPEDYARLTEAYKKTLENPEFQAWLNSNAMKGEWNGSEKSTEMIKANFEALDKYKGFLKK